jgi:hypothetical protein
MQPATEGILLMMVTALILLVGLVLFDLAALRWGAQSPYDLSPARREGLLAAYPLWHNYK